MKNKRFNYDLKLIIVLLINIIIFSVCNVIFNIKYEQVDDFIIYNLYSGLDGTYNMHGIYMHSALCFIISLLFRIIPIINWHSIYLLCMQFLCFTLIGYKIVKKHDNGISIVLYTIFASIAYTTMLLLIQYTSVAALLILTSFVLLIDMLEKDEELNTKDIVAIFLLYTLGVMTRTQAILIAAPFILVYLIINYIKLIFFKSVSKDKFFKIIKYYAVYLIITVILFLSNYLIYNSNETYREYVQYNNIRTVLHDRVNLDYEKDKQIFEEIGWSKNDYDIFYTFGFGDENIFSKENLQKLYNYAIEKYGKYQRNNNTLADFIDEVKDSKIFIFSIIVLFISLFKGDYENIILFLITILMQILYIFIGRNMPRVVIPEYIAGLSLMIYNLKLNKSDINTGLKNYTIMCLMIFFTCALVGTAYSFNYKLKYYKNYQEIIEYTNNNKQNVYLYTVPSLQFRYLAYSVYQMPPKGSFSNLRVIGGWDMYTQNYYDFKNRYQLEGTLLDLLKENVYLIDGDVNWSGKIYNNYKGNIISAIKEHYNIDTSCTKIKEFDNIKIYKLQKK